MPKRAKLSNLSDIYSFFRKNTLPIYFVNTTAFNVLGLGEWVRSFRYITYFDSFDGYHHRVLNPKDLDSRTFGSREEIVNYLLAHRSTHEFVQTNGGQGLMLTLMFDEETERLAKDLGLTMALPSAKLRMRLDSKVVTTQLGNEAGVPSAPNALGRADNYAELQKICSAHNLGDDLVIQTPYGDSGRTTFFVKNQADWNEHVDELVDQDLKVMKRINHIPYTLEAVTTRCGTLVGPVLADITGFEELTPYKGGWAGNDISRNLLGKEQAKVMQDMARALGDRLYGEGYKGTFCADFLLDTDTNEVYLGELNPRISGASALTNLVTSKYGGAPLMMFHLLEFMGLDYEIDVEQIQRRWADYDTWSQLVFKETGDKHGQITKAPVSGIWRIRKDGSIRFVRRSIDWHNVGDESEAFYMRIYGIGEDLYSGADIGILVARGRMQTDDRQLTERAKDWVRALQAEFETVTSALD